VMEVPGQTDRRDAASVNIWRQERFISFNPIPMQWPVLVDLSPPPKL
jgi:hypothetical protein